MTIILAVDGKYEFSEVGYHKRFREELPKSLKGCSLNPMTIYGLKFRESPVLMIC